MFLTLTHPSTNAWTLEDALDGFAVAFQGVRRRAAWQRMVRGGVAGVEPHLARRRALWALHAHVIVDATSLFDLGVVRELWSAATHDRGLVLEADLGLDVVAPDEATTYVTKSSDWCPEPGVLPLKALEVLAEANHRRHVMLAWGTARARP